VPGDIVRLSAGDLVPADVRLISAKDLFVNQATLTGEALPAEKHVRSAERPPQSALDMHSRNIDGVFRDLPLYEPPVDPRLLSQARAAGLGIDSVIFGQYQKLLAKSSVTKDQDGLPNAGCFRPVGCHWALSSGPKLGPAA
jgi:magnesium-transporting ATPase (P-type)